MATFTYLSRHARQRIYQRTTLDKGEVASLLDQGQFVDIGCIPGFNRRHLLFYSELDHVCLVAIRDQLTGTVVTVLPLQYHEKLAWKVSEKQCEEAQRLRNAPKSIASEISARKVAASFLISGHYIDETGHQKTKLLFTTPSIPYRNDLQELLKDEELPNRIDDSISKLHIAATDVYALSFRHGRNGDPVVITLR
jgi:hypothetical protein